MLLLGLPAWVLVQAVLALVAGRMATDYTNIAVTGVIYAVGFGAFTVLFHRKSWSSVDVTGSALGLVEKGRSVLLPWETIQSATIRRPGPFAVLQVTLRPGADAPPATSLRPRIRGDQPIYTVHVGLVRPGTGVLRSELARHLPPVAASERHAPAG
ncbi:hypothetical protein [Micromonospora sp. NPDC005979]|uniref:hypothetical protein n=1 Tax=Micromonospora sp. NPDC005979 TaxID=3156726 RepID=UPI0033BFA062